jgi:prophage regulatory protein
MSTRVLRLPQVIQRTGLCRSAIYKLMSGCRFPASVRIGDRAVAWVEEDVEAWLVARIKESRGHQVPASRRGAR